MKSLLKNIGWAVSISLVIGSLAGGADAIQALRLNPTIAEGRDRLWYFSDVAGYYGLVWAGVVTVFAAAVSALARNRQSRFSDLSAHAVSASVTLYIFVASVLWVNNRLLPSSGSALSVWGNILYLLLMAGACIVIYLALSALFGKLRRGPAAKFGHAALWLMAAAFSANAVFVLVGFRPGAGRSSAGANPGGKVILVTLDAMRPDHLSCYGYARNKTPNIDRLAAEGVLFKNAFSNAPHTYPSLTSLFTSRYAEVPGFCKLTPVPSELPSLVQMFPGRTAAVVVNFYMNSSLNVTRGFSYVYNSLEPWFLPRVSGTHLNAAMQRILLYAVKNESAELLTAQAEKWILRNRDQPFFLWLHYLEPHFPYGDKWVKIKPDPGYRGKLPERVDAIEFLEADRKGELKLSPEDVAHIEYLYDQDVAYLDRELGEFFGFLREKGLWDQSMLILSADHGEEFYERGHIGHVNFLYSELLGVPLIIKPAGPAKARTVDTQVELVDLLPTVLDLFGVSAPDAQGKSLVPLLSGQGGDFKRYVYASCNDNQKPQLALRDSRYTLVYYPRDKNYELYDRALDPGERKDIAAQNPTLGEFMLSELLKIRRSNLKLYSQLHPPGTPPASPTLDRRKMRALGYLK